MGLIDRPVRDRYSDRLFNQIEAAFDPLDPEATETFARIAAWEAGDAFPTYPQLESMAEEFRIPIAVFFFSEPPNVPPIRESFRTLPDTGFERLPRRIQYLLRKAKAFQISLIELCQGRNPSGRQITRDLKFSARKSIETMAAQVRSYLGISLEQQASWRDDEEALKEWRQTLYNVGIFVFKDAFRAGVSDPGVSFLLCVRSDISNLRRHTAI